MKEQSNEKRIVRILTKYNQNLFEITEGKPVKEESYEPLWVAAQKALLQISFDYKFRW